MRWFGLFYLRCFVPVACVWRFRETVFVGFADVFLIVAFALGFGFSAPNVTGAFSCSAALGVAAAVGLSVWSKRAAIQLAVQTVARFISDAPFKVFFHRDQSAVSLAFYVRAAHCVFASSGVVSDWLRDDVAY